MKPRLGQISFRTLAAIIVAIALSALTYVVLTAVGIDQQNALSISGLILIGGVACPIIKSNEKRLGVIFICVGFACRPLASVLLPLFGIGQALTATIGDILAVIVIVTGLAASGPIVRKLRLS